MLSKATLTRLGLDVLYFSGVYRLLEPAWGGVGLIFTLHHVTSRKNWSDKEFAPNRILEITPEFLEQAILQVRELGLDIVSLDEARRRLVSDRPQNRFVCFTLDDGYKDNYSTALPIFKKYDAPFTVYVTTGIADKKAVLWWIHLESVISDSNEIEITLSGRHFNYQLRNVVEKNKAFDQIYWYLRDLPQAEQQAAIAQLVRAYDIDTAKLCEQCGMSWELLKDLAKEDLVTVGAHTVNHHALSKLTPGDVKAEAVASRDLLSEMLGKKPVHFTYPYGDDTSAGTREFEIMDELGFATSTTTRKGVLFKDHAGYLQALPRVSLNGNYQKSRYVRLYLSGAPFAFWNRFQKLKIK
jgi:peptidoglycan/xylan/chitin deacetylase (PgdA/CDA1 family)